MAHVLFLISKIFFPLSFIFIAHPCYHCTNLDDFDRKSSYEGKNPAKFDDKLTQRMVSFRERCRKTNAVVAQTVKDGWTVNILQWKMV